MGRQPGPWRRFLATLLPAGFADIEKNSFAVAPNLGDVDPDAFIENLAEKLDFFGSPHRFAQDL
jgi:hypothetical protein